MTLLVLLYSLNNMAFLYFKPTIKMIFVSYVIYTNPKYLRDKEVIIGKLERIILSYRIAGNFQRTKLSQISRVMITS